MYSFTVELAKFMANFFFILFQTLGCILRCVASAVLNVHTENRRTQIIFLLLCALCLVDFVEWHFICLPSSADCNDDTFFCLSVSTVVDVLYRFLIQL